MNPAISQSGISPTRPLDNPPALGNRARSAKGRTSMVPRVFLSHAPSEKDDIQQLRRALEDRGIASIGDGSKDTRAPIHAADAFVLLLSPKSIGSDSVQREVQWALERAMTEPAYRLVVLLRGMATGAVPLLFGAAEPVCFPVPDGLWIDAAAKAIRQALGGPTDGLPAQGASPAPPMAELTLEFFQAKLVTAEGKSRAAGTLRLDYTPAEGGRGILGTYTEFVSPLGPTDAEDLRWYIEDYFRWPFDVFRDRAKGIEAKLPQWGQLLYDAIVRVQEEPMQAFIKARREDGNQIERRITINVDDRKSNAEDKDAAALLFGLPWELLHDGNSYLFDGAVKARVRRTLPSDVERPRAKPRERVRVLLVRARPEDESAAFLDPRASAMPLVEALHELGDHVKLDILPDGTFEAMQKALTDAEEAKDPYQVVHFDGHGVYDKVRGLGLLCFENAEDTRTGIEKRRADPVEASKIGGLLRDRRVPLFVLEACQTATAEKQSETSVAAELLRQGVVSVVAMRYSVVVPTATEFVHAFYGALVKGKRIGTAMVEAQLALKHAPVRLDFGAKGRLSLEDWMVPVLFQEGDDPQIFVGGVDTRPAAIEDRKKVDAVRRGDLPQLPGHGFVGRAKELLRIERRIRCQRRVAILGRGGEGKTALAAEAARWFLLTQQRERVAFVSVERLSDARAVLDAIGRQLVAGYSVATAEAGGSDAVLPVKKALQERKTLLVIDNFESLIALAGKDPTNGEAVRAIVNLVHELANVGETWLITTSREPLQTPLDGNELRVGSLDPRDARELLVSVLRDKGIEPAHEGKSTEEMENALASLIEAVGGHARSLVLLGPNIAGRGIEATRDAIRNEMAELDKLNPEDREKSLLASVRISLGRLDPETRTKIAPLCAFRQAAPVPIMAHVLEIELNEALDLCRKLIALGLAQADRLYLLPDPAMGVALSLEIGTVARASAEQRWQEGMLSLARFLYEEHFRDTQIAAHGTNVALLDLVAALETAAVKARAGTESVEVVMPFVTKLELLISSIRQPRELARVRTIREDLTRFLPTWSHARFIAESKHIDQLLESGNMQVASDAAQRLRDAAERAGDAYPHAAYDRARASLKLGRVLRMAGDPEPALRMLEEARHGFAALAEVGDSDAQRMAVVSIAEQGDALRDLGQIDDASEKYGQAIYLHEEQGHLRDAAVIRGQLGTLRMYQGRYAEALELWHEHRSCFEALGEPAGIATSWHQIGVIHHEAGQFAPAQHAYLESLRLAVSLGNRTKEASTLAQLAGLLRDQGRLDDAAVMYRKAIALYEILGDTAKVSSVQYNLGVTLHHLGRLDEAREALKASLAIKMQFGHTAEPWNAWWSLSDVERDASRSDAAAIARAQAMTTYRAYRTIGGEATENWPPIIVSVGKLLLAHGQGTAVTALQKLHSNDAQDDPPSWIAMLRALDAIVAGNRDPALADDSALTPIVAVELQLLLESLIAAGN